MDNTTVTGFYVLDGLLTREFDASADALWHLILPAVTLATIPLAVIVRITRASVLDVLNEDYVRTAEAKGLRHRDHPAAAHPAQRPAAGGHHHRSADRRAARRRGADREGLQLGRPRHPDRRLDQRRPGLSGAPGDASCSPRWSSCWSTCWSTSRTPSSTRGCVCDEHCRPRSKRASRPAGLASTARPAGRAGPGARRCRRLRRNPVAIVGAVIVAAVRAGGDLRAR